MNSKQRPRRKVLQCHLCRKLGHIKRNCRELSGEKLSQKEKRGSNYKVNKSATKRQDCNSSDSESAGLVLSHALSASSSCEHNTWIVDSGATSKWKDDKIHQSCVLYSRQRT